MAKIVMIAQKSLSWDAVVERGKGNRRSFSLGKTSVQKEEQERRQKAPGEGRAARLSLTERGRQAGGRMLQEGSAVTGPAGGEGELLALLMGPLWGLCCHQFSKRNESGEGSRDFILLFP